MEWKRAHYTALIFTIPISNVSKKLWRPLMQRIRKFDSAVRILLSLAILMFVTSNAGAESLHGKFANGQAYSGEYSVTESTNSDGMRVNPVTVKLKVDGVNDLMLYTYVADDVPSIKSSDLGFLSIVVNSGGMEGSVTYNYVVPCHGNLLSIGIVQTTLHLGKIEHIDVQPNEKLSNSDIIEYIRKIIRFNPSALPTPSDAYSAATLLMLGQGNFLTPEDKSIRSDLYLNKEISNDPVLLQAIKRVISHGTRANGDTLAPNEKSVVSSRAYFFNAPRSSSIERSYLIRGDVISLVKRSGDGKYWLSDYISPHGLKTEKWLRCEDLSYCR